MREETADIAAGVFEAAIVQRRGEGHVAVARRHVEVLEQCDQVGIVQRVVDDEAGVDGERAATVIDRDRVAVAAQLAAGFEQRDAMRGIEQPGRTQARDTAADHRYVEWRAARWPLIHDLASLIPRREWLRVAGRGGSRPGLP